MSPLGCVLSAVKDGVSLLEQNGYKAAIVYLSEELMRALGEPLEVDGLRASLFPEGSPYERPGAVMVAAE